MGPPSWGGLGVLRGETKLVQLAGVQLEQLRLVDDQCRVGAVLQLAGPLLAQVGR